MNVGRVEAELRAVFHGRGEAEQFEKLLRRLKAETRKEIRADVKARVDDRGLRRASRHMNEINANANAMRGGLLSATTALGGMNKGMIAASAGVAGLGAAYATIKSSIDTTTDLAKSTRLLMSTMRKGPEEASQWAELLRSYGVNGQQAAVGFARLNKNLVAAERGSKPMTQALTDLGISVQDIDRLGIDGVITKTADAFKGGVPSQRASAAALQLFGRNYRNLLPILRGGSEGIRENLRFIKEYGAYLTAGGVKNAGDFAKAQRQMRIAMDGIKIAIGTQVIPELIKVMPKIRDLILAFSQGKGPYADFANNMRSIASAVGKAVKVIADLANSPAGAAILIGLLGLKAGSAAGKIVTFAGALSKVAPAMTGLSAGLFAPLMAFMAGAAGLKLSADFIRLISGNYGNPSQKDVDDFIKDPTGLRGQADKVRGARGATRRTLTAPKADLRPVIGQSLGQVTQQLARVKGVSFQYKASVAVNTENATNRIRLLDAAAKSKLSKPRILKILGDKRPADQKIAALEGKKLAPKTQKVRGDTADAQGKIDKVKNTKIPPKTAKVTAAGNAWSQVKNLLSDLGSIAGRVWTAAVKKVGGRRGGRASTIAGYAMGGRVPGRPEPRDSVLAMLSPGEFVVTADGERRLEQMTFPGVLNRLETSQLPHFANGGRVRGRFVSGWQQQISDAQRRYQQKEREYQLSGDQITPAEYDKLISSAGSIRGMTQDAVNKTSRLIQRTKRAERAASRSRRTADRNRLPGIRQQLRDYTEALRDWRFSLEDQRLDIVELRGNRDKAKEVTISQLATQFADFQAARASAFASFGSNFVSANGVMTSAMPIAGMRYFGGGARNPLATAASGTTVRITNNFQQGPSDPHSWSRGVSYELGALL